MDSKKPSEYRFAALFIDNNAPFNYFWANNCIMAPNLTSISLYPSCEFDPVLSFPVMDEDSTGEQYTLGYSGYYFNASFNEALG